MGVVYNKARIQYSWDYIKIWINYYERKKRSKINSGIKVKI